MVFETTTTRLVAHRLQHKVVLTTIIPTPITAIGLFCTTVTVGMGNQPMPVVRSFAHFELSDQRVDTAQHSEENW